MNPTTGVATDDFGHQEPEGVQDKRAGTHTPPPSGLRPLRPRCKNGHALVEANVVFDKDGNGRCRECRREATRRYAKKKRAERTDKNPRNIRRHHFDSVSKADFKSLRQAERREAIRAYKLVRGGCCDCGSQENLDLDHRPGTVKLFCPADVSTRTWQSLFEEWAKCDVRCKSCHSLRHRAGMFPGSPDQPLKLVCSWCGVTIREGAPPVSHGMCKACASKWEDGASKWEDE